MVFVAKSLERIGDHATTIFEHVGGLGWAAQRAATSVSQRRITIV